MESRALSRLAAEWAIPLPFSDSGKPAIASFNGSSPLRRSPVDHEIRGPGRVLRRLGACAVHHHRYRVPARKDLLADPLPGADRRPGDRPGGGDRYHGAGAGPGAAGRAAEKHQDHEGLPRGAAGRRNLLPHDRRHPQADRRHPGAGDGVRVRRCRQLRDAGRQARQCAAGQAGALHRLGAPAALGAATRLRAVGRDPSARHLSEAARQGGEDRAPRLDRRRDGAADRSRHLRVQSGECVEAAEDALGEAALPRRAERGRGVARARGAEPRRAAQPRAERREHRRDRRARAGDRRKRWRNAAA